MPQIKAVLDALREAAATVESELNTAATLGNEGTGPAFSD
jgi:hypothetical protein